MHSKGDAAKFLKEKLNIDKCIYMGNDLNDISMFSNALDDNDFIVIASNEHKEITELLVNYLKEECKIKGIQWSSVKLLILQDENVNSFLKRMRKVLTIVSPPNRIKSIKKEPKKYILKDNWSNVISINKKRMEDSNYR